MSAGREIKSISISSDRGFDGAEPSTATTEYSGGSHPHKHTHTRQAKQSSEEEAEGKRKKTTPTKKKK